MRALHSSAPNAAVAVAVAVAAALALAGCSGEMASFTDIEDMRVLAIQATPPLVAVDDPSLPSEIVFEALVLDPRGGPIDYTWTFCPVESSKACADYEQLRNQAVAMSGASYVEALDAAHAITSSGTALPVPAALGEPTAETMRPYAIATFSVPTATLLGLASYYRDNGFFGFGTGAWPSAILTLTRSDESEPLVTQKRLVVTVADLAAYNIVFDEYLHIHFCASAEDTDCLPWDPTLVHNTNPDFVVPMQLARGESALGTFVTICAPGQDPAIDACEPPTVTVGEKVRILPAFPPEMNEAYQTLEADLESGVISVAPSQEDISVSWFAAGGSVLDQVTWPKFTKTLDTVYTAPADLTGTFDGTAVIWMVAQDARGGTGWTHLELTVTAP